MNRLTKIILKNIFRVPSIFGRIYWYAAHPERYSGEEKLRPLQYIVERAKSAEIWISKSMEERIFRRRMGIFFIPIIREFLMVLQ